FTSPQLPYGLLCSSFQIDNKGNHLLVHEESSINVPAIAAAHVIKRYIAQAADELSFEVGDIVSVIDMPPKELTTWWRGKHGFQ
ncbi:RHG32 protein, partial [Pedionomus torquatus]|nr:RHG32 protein [Pedionomus torquatus]